MKHLYLLFAGIVMIALVGCNRQSDIFETEQYSLQEVFYLTPEAQDSLTIDMSVELPTRMASDSLLIAMQSNLKEALFGEAFAAMEPQHALEAYVAMIKTEYRENNSDMEMELEQEEQPEAGFFCEDQYLNGQVMDIRRGVISYGIERYVYMGGAHGQNTRIFSNYCLETGKELHLHDIFVPEADEVLRDMIIDGLIAQNEECSSVKDLIAAGYWVDQIHPTDNFYLAEDGIVFVYNQYDIAPYAVGESSSVLTWDQIDSYLEPWLKEEK